MKMLCVTATIFVSAIASAETVAEKKAWDKIAEESKQAASSLKTACGVDITIMPDKESWSALELAKNQARWCVQQGEVAIRSLCSDVDYKAAIARSLKKVTCVNDEKLGTGTPEKNGNMFSLKDGVLEWRYHKGSANLARQATDYLKGAL